MDFLSRDRYREAAEELAEASGEAQLRVALRTIESARLAAGGSTDERAAHVGYHLIGKGRRELETDVAYRPGWWASTTLLVRSRYRDLPRRDCPSHGVSLGPRPRLRPPQGGSLGQAAAALLLLLPASELAVASCKVLALIDSAATAATAGLHAGIPAKARTMVVIPTLFTSVRSDKRLEHLEVLALGNIDPQISFAILSDFRTRRQRTCRRIHNSHGRAGRHRRAERRYGQDGRFFIFPSRP